MNTNKHQSFVSIRVHSWLQRLFAPVDIASLVVFRILFGAIMMVEVGRYFNHGWIRSYFITPQFHFTYYGFDWVKPWPGNGMYIHFVVIAIAALGVMLGAWYRISAAILFLAFTYVFLLDQAYYLNHFYMVSLLCFLMIFIPAHRAPSIDSWRRPKLKSDDAPAWALGLLLAQISIVYFYAGIAKLNPDWLRGEPMRSWLAEREDTPVIGQFFTEEWMVFLFNSGGLAFDLLIVPLLLWKRTRVFAFIWALAFHLLNTILFSIGIFPWLMIAATLLYFRPDWPRIIFRWTRSQPPMDTNKHELAESKQKSQIQNPKSKITMGLVVAYILFQVLVPLRHFLYPGPVHWSEEGHRFSWHMKLRDKQAKARFLVTDPVQGTTWEVHPRRYLTSRQTFKMAARPDMVLQMAHHVAREQAKRRKVTYPLEVRARVMASLNSRPDQLLIDPNVNLAAQKRSLRTAKWILPLE